MLRTLKGALLLFTSLFCAPLAFGQPQCDSLLGTNVNTVSAWRALLSEQYQLDAKAISGDYASEKKLLYKSRYDLVAEHFEGTELVTDPTVTKFVG
jgi:hypothetical protein